jgi:hypothetical protein
MEGLLSATAYDSKGLERPYRLGANETKGKKI